MTHWQIKLIDWRHGKTEWYGKPSREMSRIYPGMWIDKIEPYKYSSLEAAKFTVASFSDKMKSAYQIKIFKITPKRKR